MKIRMRMMLNNFLVGLIPVMIFIVVFMFIYRSQMVQNIVNNLDNALENMETRIEYDNEKMRFFAFNSADTLRWLFLSHPEYGMSNTLANYLDRGTGWGTGGYDTAEGSIQIEEYSYLNHIISHNASEYEYVQYYTSDETYLEIWDFMKKPMNHQYFRMSFPEIVSNNLVIRNAAIIYNEIDSKKEGLSLKIHVIDREYISDVVGDSSDMIAFIEHDSGFTFSESISNEKAFQAIRDLTASEELQYTAVDFKEAGKFYVAKRPRYSKTVNVSNRMVSLRIADIGIMYSADSIKEQTMVLRNIGVIIGILITFLVIIAAVLFARNISNPILYLQRLVTDFKSGVQSIPAPEKVEDEISMLQKSFSEMSEEILDYQKRLTEALNEAKTANLRKSKFLANMSHELRTPLNSINGIADLLRFGSYEVSDEIGMTLSQTIIELNEYRPSKKSDASKIKKLKKGLSRLLEYIENDGNLKSFIFLDSIHIEKLPDDLKSVIESRIETITGYIEKEEREVFKAYKYIKESGTYLLGLIDLVLNLSKVEAGKIEIKKRKTNIRDLIRTTLMDAENYCRNKGKSGQLNLVSRIDSDVPDELSMDPQKIKQVLLNFMSNAIKYSFEGDIILSVENEGDYAKFVVRDHGIGIPDDEKEKIFTEFGRTNATNKIEGTGLGLALSKRLIEMQGGKIGFESFSNKGSSFWFTISMK